MATSETRQMIGILLKGDPTVERAVREDIMRLLDGKAEPALTDKTPIDRVLTRKEVAALLGVHTRTVTNYARRGVIRPVRLGRDGRRSVGYSESSVRAALAGGAATSN